MRLGRLRDLADIAIEAEIVALAPERIRLSAKFRSIMRLVVPFEDTVMGPLIRTTGEAIWAEKEIPPRVTTVTFRKVTSSAV